VLAVRRLRQCRRKQARFAERHPFCAYQPCRKARDTSLGTPQMLAPG
jgi:hypothetical protein